MNDSIWIRTTFVATAIALVCLSGCPGPIPESEQNAKSKTPATKPETKTTKASESGKAKADQPTARTATATAEDVAAAKQMLDEIGATYKIVPDDVLTEVAITDGSSLDADKIALLAKLTDLESLQILDYRDLDNEQGTQLAALTNLQTLSLTNSGIGDEAITAIVDACPKLNTLDLSYNANLTNTAFRKICELAWLERLTLIQTGFSDLGMIRVTKLEKLKVLDIRGNSGATNSTVGRLARLPNLQVFKHRAPVGDSGIEKLAESTSLQSLLMHDFDITELSGPYLAQLENLSELEIFRCQKFSSDGVLALKGKPLTRLKLRDLPAVNDSALAVCDDLPTLERLYLHELESVSDEGLKSLGNLKTLKILDIWSLPQMTDATMDVIATLPELQELSIRATAVTDAAVDTLLAMPKLKTLTFKENGSVTEEALKKLKTKEWTKLDTGS